MHCRQLPLCLGSGSTCDPFPGCCCFPPLTPTTLLPFTSHSCECCSQWWPLFRGWLYTQVRQKGVCGPHYVGEDMEALRVQSPHFCPELVASEAWALVTDPQGPPLLTGCSLLCTHSGKPGRPHAHPSPSGGGLSFLCVDRNSRGFETRLSAHSCSQASLGPWRRVPGKPGFQPAKPITFSPVAKPPFGSLAS